MTVYCSLADVKAENNADETTANAVEDRKIMTYIRDASRRFDERLKSSVPFFAPYKGSRDVQLLPSSINSFNRTILLSYPFLSITGVSIGSRVLTVGTNAQSYPVGQNPFMALQLIGCDVCSWYDYCASTTPTNATLTGISGFHLNYAQAWLASDTLIDAVNSTAKTIEVGDVDGENDYGEIPAISAGNLIQIDEEWMDVISTNTVANTVKVVRGVNGSTAAAHSADAVVSVFQVDTNVRRAITRQSALMYSRKGAFETRRMDGIATIEYPADMLLEVNNILAMYVNL